MLLAIAAGLPVVAAVATRDRYTHLVHCPYCHQIHRHGGHGPGSPLGAVDGGRMAHCHTGRDEARRDGIATLRDAGVVRRFYVIKEVPGRATVRWNSRAGRSVDSLTYDYDGIATMGAEIAALVRRYEAVWAGGDLPRHRSGSAA